MGPIFTNIIGIFHGTEILDLQRNTEASYPRGMIQNDIVSSFKKLVFSLGWLVDNF